MADPTPQQQPQQPAAASTFAAENEEEEEEVFEIREWIDADGREVSSEVVSVKAAAAVAQLDLVGALQRAQEQQQAAAAGSGGEQTQAAEPSPAQRLLDAHDWAGIKARADELEREQARVRGGEVAKEADARRGRDKLEGGGWGKGFLNNGGGGGKGGGGSSNETAKQQANKAKQQQQQLQQVPQPAAVAVGGARGDAPATRTVATKSALSSPEKRKMAGDRPRKHVSFQLDDLDDAEGEGEGARGGFREPGPFDDYQRLLQQHRQLRAAASSSSARGWGEGEGDEDEEREECKDEAKRQPRPLPQQRQRPVAFSGRVGERGAAPTEVGAALMPAAPSAAGPMAVASAAAVPAIPPGMSKFKARKLGLLPPESN